MYDVFISFKKTEVGKDKKTEDFYIAQRLNDELNDIGIKAFFSEESLVDEGTGDYKNSIIKAISDAKVFVLVSTKVEYFNSTWVKSEWDQYDNLRREGKKENDSVFILSGADLMQNRPDEFAGKQMVNKDQIDVLVTFIKNRFEKTKHVSEDLEGSWYTYDNTNESSRLLEQAIIEARYDVDYIKEIFSDKNKTYNILDVGCSAGGITKQIFGKLSENGYKIKVIGIDHFKEQVDKFNTENKKDNMIAYAIEVGSLNWINNINEIMAQEKINCFDLVYCAFSLLHMPKGGQDILKGLYSILANDGYLYFRGEDDQLKVLYPNEDVLSEILKMSSKDVCPGICDRFHARKMYKFLREAEFKEIEYRSFLIDTIGSDKKIKELMIATNDNPEPITKEDLGNFIFSADFVWRIDDFEHNVEISKNTDRYQQACNYYEKMKTNINLMREYLTDSMHYFGYYITIVIAKKKAKRISI